MSGSTPCQAESLQCAQGNGKKSMCRPQDMNGVVAGFKTTVGEEGYRSYAQQTSEVLEVLLVYEHMQQLLKTLRSSNRQDALGTSFLTILSWCKMWQDRTSSLQMQASFDSMKSGM